MQTTLRTDLTIAIFSNSTNSRLYLWKNFVRGDVMRQEILRTALEWVVKSSDDAAVEKLEGQRLRR